MDAGWIFTEAAGEQLRRERAEDAAFWAARRRPAPLVTVTATMADGTVLVEEAADFNVYLDLVLPLRRDPDVAELRWEVAMPRRAA